MLPVPTGGGGAGAPTVVRFNERINFKSTLYKVRAVFSEYNCRCLKCIGSSGPGSGVYL